MDQSGLGGVLTEARSNAAAAWVLTAVAVVAVVGNAVAVAPLWAGFALVVVVLALVPPLTYRDPTAMLPWEVLLLATLPLLARVIAALQSDVVTYVAVSALALVVAVELHLLTPVEMNERFAVGFVVLATMAAAGVWAVVRYGSDVLLGTTLLLPPGGVDAPEEALAAVERELMVEFVASFVAGVVAGALFELYFRRAGRAEALVGASERPER